jgi:hypothetical protein
MADLEWEYSPRTRGELYEVVLAEAKRLLASGNLSDSVLDMTMEDLVKFVTESIAHDWEHFRRRFSDEYLPEFPSKSVIAAFMLGFTTGVVYKQRDDHTWEEE